MMRALSKEHRYMQRKRAIVFETTADFSAYSARCYFAHVTAENKKGNGHAQHHTL